jgi:hypothetical protein
MPEENDKGTGRHAHKSTGEPWPHRESGSGGQRGGSQSQAQSGNQERGDLKNREYRDAEGNVHHHTRTFKEQHSGSDSGQQDGQQHSSSGQSQGNSGNNSNRSGNLQEREYRDKEGNEHHHTRTYEEQHRKGS